GNMTSVIGTVQVFPVPAIRCAHSGPNSVAHRTAPLSVLEVRPVLRGIGHWPITGEVQLARRCVAQVEHVAPKDEPQAVRKISRLSLVLRVSGIGHDRVRLRPSLVINSHIVGPDY